MAVPLLTLLALIARVAASIITRPTLWLVLLGWFTVSKFDLRVFSREVQQSISDLWWLVVLILITAICNTAIKAYFQARRGR